MFSIVYNSNRITVKMKTMTRSYPVSARISEDSKIYLESLVEMGIAINKSEALKLCIRYAKQKKMEEEL